MICVLCSKETNEENQKTIRLKIAAIHEQELHYECFENFAANPELSKFFTRDKCVCGRSTDHVYDRRAGDTVAVYWRKGWNHPWHRTTQSEKCIQNVLTDLVWKNLEEKIRLRDSKKLVPRNLEPVADENYWIPEVPAAPPPIRRVLGGIFGNELQNAEIQVVAAPPRPPQYRLQLNYDEGAQRGEWRIVDLDNDQ